MYDKESINEDGDDQEQGGEEESDQHESDE